MKDTRSIEEKRLGALLAAGEEPVSASVWEQIEGRLDFIAGVRAENAGSGTEGATGRAAAPAGRRLARQARWAWALLAAALPALLLWLYPRTPEGPVQKDAVAVVTEESLTVTPAEDLAVAGVESPAAESLVEPGQKAAEASGRKAAEKPRFDVVRRGSASADRLAVLERTEKPASGSSEPAPTVETAEETGIAAAEDGTGMADGTGDPAGESPEIISAGTLETAAEQTPEVAVTETTPLIEETTAWDERVLDRLEREDQWNAASTGPCRLDVFADAATSTASSPTDKRMRVSALDFNKEPIIETSPSTYTIPVSVGASFHYTFAPGWSAGAGISFSALNRHFSGTKMDYSRGTPQAVAAYDDISNTQFYLGIPVQVAWRFVSAEKVGVYAWLGGSAEWCVSDYFFFVSDRSSFSRKVDRPQFSAGIGLGFDYAFSEHFSLYADPSLRYWFSNGQPRSIRTAQPLLLGFEIGLRFRL